MLSHIKKNLIVIALFSFSLTPVGTPVVYAADPLILNATANNASDDDAIEINNAIQAMPSGSTLEIPFGTYHLKSPIELKSGIRIKGIKGLQGTDLKPPIFTTLYEEYEGQRHLMQGVNVSNVVVESLRLKSNLSDIGIDDLIRIVDSSNVTINDVIFERFGEHAVYFNNTENGQVKNSLLKNATRLGGGGEGYGVVFTNGCNTGRVEESSFMGPNLRHGVVIQGNKEPWNPSHDIVVKNNYFENTTQDAIDLHGTGEYANYIEYNTIVGTDPTDEVGRGIGVGENVHGPSGTRNVIKNNIIRGTRYGIHVLTRSSDVTIRNNIIENCLRYGIYVQDGSFLDIRDNQITGCQNWGINIEKGFNITIRKSTEGNVVTNNGLKSNSVGGIYVDPSIKNIDIQDNDFCGNSVNSILAIGVVVKNNRCL